MMMMMMMMMIIIIIAVVVVVYVTITMITFMVHTPSLRLVVCFLHSFLTHLLCLLCLSEQDGFYYGESC